MPIYYSNLGLSHLLFLVFLFEVWKIVDSIHKEGCDLSDFALIHLFIKIKQKFHHCQLFDILAYFIERKD